MEIFLKGKWNCGGPPLSKQPVYSSTHSRFRGCLFNSQGQSGRDGIRNSLIFRVENLNQNKSIEWGNVCLYWCSLPISSPLHWFDLSYYCKTCNKFRLTCKVWPQQNSSFEQRVSKFIPQINTHRICKLHRQWAPELWSPFTVQGHWRSAVQASWIKRSIQSEMQKGPLYYEELLHSTEMQNSMFFLKQRKDLNYSRIFHATYSPIISPK